MLALSQSNCHWYKYDNGEFMPCYFFPKKDGSGDRPATLSDAKKHRLFPGISSIVNVLPKPNLINWRITQAVLASLTLPRNEGEGEDAYAQRIIEDAEAQSAKARDFGSQIHQGIEDWMNNLHIRTPSHIKDYLKGFYDWASENIEGIHGTEQVVGDPALGIAGRLDADVTIKGIGRCVIDAKTQGIKKGKPTFYDEWLPQLCAYEHCIRREDQVQRELVSIVINSTQPDVVHVNHWFGAREQGWKIFQHCLELWKWTNGFDPSHV